MKKFNKSLFKVIKIFVFLLLLISLKFLIFFYGRNSKQALCNTSALNPLTIHDYFTILIFFLFCEDLVMYKTGFSFYLQRISEAVL